jgi:hypothetical protein
MELQHNEILLKRLELNERARNNYKNRKDKGVEKKIKPKEEQLKRGPKPKAKIIVNKNSIGKPIKNINNYTTDEIEHLKVKLNKPKEEPKEEINKLKFIEFFNF